MTFPSSNRVAVLVAGKATAHADRRLRDRFDIIAFGPADPARLTQEQKESVRGIAAFGEVRAPFIEKHGRYAYSHGGVTLYLGLKGIELRDYGFGSFNVWSYPHDDIDRIYREQSAGDLSSPWLFLSTPTLHSDAPGLAPPGGQILEVATHAPHAPWRELRDRDPRAYNMAKKKLREHLFDVIEARFVPHLRDHVDVFAIGSPATNERFVHAPRGNSYGAALVPANVNASRRPVKTSLENLWLCEATAGWPSIGGTVGTGRNRAHRLIAGRDWAEPEER